MSEGFDLFERLAQTESGRRVLEGYEDAMRRQDGTAAQAQWIAEDGWIIIYTTSRVVDGPHDGKFVTQLMKPTGKGARTGTATRFVESYRRAFATRKAAKKRAVALYAQHSPTWAARNQSYLERLGLR